jgi:hypothetical protein
MKLNFDDIKETLSIDEGTVEVTIVGAKERTSANGTNMLSIVVKDAEEKVCSDNICTEGPGAFKMKQFLKAVGVSEEDAAGMEAADFIGMTLTIEVVKEEYEGVERSKIKKYIA